MNRKLALLARHQRERRRVWRCAVAALSMCVAGVTAYALMRPASTKARTLVCSKPEHEHAAACYAAPTFSCTYQPHVHTEACYESESGGLLCGRSDFVLHEHDWDCFDADGRLICFLPEKKEHTHTDECWTEGNEPTCGLIECEAHEHAESCYTEQSLLVCENAEEGHEHDESCYQPQHILTCTLPASEGHTHTEDCYGEPAYVLACDKEELHFHEHTVACYDAETGERICGETELLSHQHTDCWLRPVEPVCGVEEHIHTDGCYEELPDYELSEPIYCGLGAHQHTADCYDGAGELHCTIPEHTHEESCYFPVQPTEPDAAEEEQPALLGEVGLPETLEQLDAIWAGTPEDLRPALLTAWLSADGESFETLLAQYEAATAGELFALLRASYDVSNITTLEAEALTEIENNENAETLYAAFTKDETSGLYVATVTFSDNTTASATLPNWVSADVLSSQLVATRSCSEATKYNHGLVTIDNGFIFKLSSNASCSVDGVTISITSQTELTPNDQPEIFYHDENGTLQKYATGNWQGVVLSEDKKSLTTGAHMALSTTSSLDFLIDHWTPTDDNYLDWQGPPQAAYAISYILQNYNIFIQDDVKATHIVGPVMVGGALTTSGLGGLSHGDTFGAPHRVPSYVGYTNYDHIITANENIPVYLGPAMLKNDKKLSIMYAAGQTTDNYWYTNNYIDFSAAEGTLSPAMQIIQNQMETFISENQTAIVLSTDPSVVRNASNVVTSLPAGKIYEFSNGDFMIGQAGQVSLTGLQDAEQDTIIIIHATDVNGVKTAILPTLTNNGAHFGSVEVANGTGIVFACPDAEVVEGDEITGHIIAPKAKVQIKSGYYNGCIIAKELDTGTAEGHMWPYKGRLLQPKSHQLEARKLLDNRTPTENEKFTFILEELQADGTMWTQVGDPVQNNGSSIVFPEVIYDGEDDGVTHTYRISEVSDVANNPGILFDDSRYYIYVTVTKIGNSLSTAATYWKADDSESGAHGITAEEVVFHNRTSYELPETGGPALWLTLAGALLVSLSAFCLIPRRRKERA